MRFTILAVATMALAACATMSEDECRSADWRTFGLEDGANGRMPSNIAHYRKSCADYGVRPNLEEYQAGHAEGARHFCTPTNGFAKGRAGANGYENFCPDDLARPFVDAYQRGRTVYAAEQQVARARTALESIESEIDALDESIVDHTALVATDGTPTDQRVLLAKELVEMGNRRAFLTGERPRAERALSAAEAELSRVLRENSR